jgi:heme exporter protein C
MKGVWWKFGGVFIFMYVLIGGLMTPLNPGVTSVSPSRAESGSVVRLSVTGYNTHLKTGGEIRAWLKLDSIYNIRAVEIVPSDENHAEFTFALPNTFPDAGKVYPLTLIIDNETDGAFVQPSALFVRHPEDVSAFDQDEWTRDKITALHQKGGTGFPYRNILNETIRNTFFHVALWFAMFLLLIAGIYYSILYLRTKDISYDIRSASFTRIAIMYGILGLLTGSIWAKFTWNTFWTTDVKLNMTAVAMLIYLAYLVLRGSSTDQDKRAKLSAVYSIFAFIALIPLVFVIPRLADSLHPGNGGNPALGGEDLDNTLRMYFYPSIIALTMLGTWMATLLIRYDLLKDRIMTETDEI